MSQEMGEKDREGIIDGFSNLGSDVGNHLAGTIKERGEMKDAATMKQ
jgi:transcriptional regulator